MCKQKCCSNSNFDFRTVNPRPGPSPRGALGRSPPPLDPERIHISDTHRTAEMGKIREKWLRKCIKWLTFQKIFRLRRLSAPQMLNFEINSLQMFTFLGKNAKNCPENENAQKWSTSQKIFAYGAYCQYMSINEFKKRRKFFEIRKIMPKKPD